MKVANRDLGYCKTTGCDRKGKHKYNGWCSKEHEAARSKVKTNAN